MPLKHRIVNWFCDFLAWATYWVPIPASWSDKIGEWVENHQYGYWS